MADLPKEVVPETETHTLDNKPPKPTPIEQARAAGFLGFSGLSTIYGALIAEMPLNHCDAQVFGRVEIGSFTYFNYGCEVCDAVIGRYCSIGQRVIINPSGHPMDRLSTHPFVEPHGANATGMGSIQTFRDICATEAESETAASDRSVRIGHDVWIGATALILPKITIGTGAIVGAGAVVTKDVEPYSIVVGIPARHLRFRFDPLLVSRLLSSEWWDWDLSGMPGPRNYHDASGFLDRFLKARNAGLLVRYSPQQIAISEHKLIVPRPSEDWP